MSQVVRQPVGVRAGEALELLQGWIWMSDGRDLHAVQVKEEIGLCTVVVPNALCGYELVRRVTATAEALHIAPRMAMCRYCLNRLVKQIERDQRLGKQEAIVTGVVLQGREEALVNMTIQYAHHLTQMALPLGEKWNAKFMDMMGGRRNVNRAHGPIAEA